MAPCKECLRVLQKVKPYFCMILLQFLVAGMYVLSELTLKAGMSQYVFVVFRNIAGFVVIAPFAFLFERKKIPRVTVISFLKITALALLDPLLQQNLFYLGAKITSASFASTLENVNPSITYFVALVLRLEALKMGQRYCQAKIIGSIVNVGGAILMILYKGPILHLPLHSTFKREDSTSNGSSKWTEGTFSVLGSTSMWSFFLILQSNALESFPVEQTMSAMICLMGAAMSAVVAVVAELGNSRPWAIGWDRRLFVVFYSGLAGSGFGYYLQGVVMKEKGPVFVCAFGPLSSVFTIIMGYFFLSEKITAGLIVGAIIMVLGIYFILWGMSKDPLSPQKIENERESLAVDLMPNDLPHEPPTNFNLESRE